MRFKYSLGVIIPVYNVEKYLKECLESVVNQTIRFDEIVLINDGSFDNSEQICKQYCEKYPYIRLINQKNKGAGAARNCGLSYLKSDYIVFLDSDDYVVLWMVETIKRKLQDQDILFYASEICENIEGSEHTNFYLRNKALCGYVMSGLEFFYQTFPQNYIVSPCMAVYKRKFLEDYHIRFPEGLYYEDDCFYMETVIHARKIESISAQLYVRRYRSGSIMTTEPVKKNCLDKMKIETIIWNHIKKSSLVKWKRDVLCNYLLSGVVEVMWLMEQYKGIEDINEQVNLFMEKFIKYWGDLCENNLGTLYNYYVLLNIYKKLFGNSEEYKGKYKKIKNQLVKRVQQELYSLHLGDKNIKVGIYGMGRHTKVMLRLYEEYVGKIYSEYLYIVSDIEQMDKMLVNRSHIVVSYENIPQDVDLIIISSLTYMDDMIENLKKAKIKEEKIHTLYRTSECFDLVKFDEFIKNEPDYNI